MSEPVNVDVKLGVNKFHVDEGHPHIVIREHPDMAAFRLLTLACPAGLYKQLEDGGIRFDYAGCSMRHLSHSVPQLGAGRVGLPTRYLRRGVSIRLMLQRQSRLFPPLPCLTSLSGDIHTDSATT